MKDGVPKQTGNSRFLKSAISSNITFEQFRDMLRNGTLPIDINGINASGWAELGTPLNKASLMSGTVESQYGLSSTNTPSDVFIKIKSLIDEENTNVNSKAEIVIGSYVGQKSTSNNNRTTRTISLGFKPKAVILAREGYQFSYNFTTNTETGYTAALITKTYSTVDVRNPASIEDDGFKVFNYTFSYTYISFDTIGYTYHYIAFK